MKSKQVSLKCYGAMGSQCKNPIVGRVDEPDRHGARALRCLEHGGNPNAQCVIDAYIDWNEGYANTPSLHVLMHHSPEWNNDEPIWHQNGPLYYAEKEGIVHFHSYTKPDRGFGGAMYRGTLVDGTPFEHKGPWSSNSAAMNKAGFGPVIEASLAYFVDPTNFSGGGVKIFEKGYTFMGGAITLEYATEALRYSVQGVSLMWVNGSLIPVKIGARGGMVHGTPPDKEEFNVADRSMELDAAQGAIVKG